ncbi:MAG TPA: hypothetical protein VFL91_05765 [Thermomicrobiales bacterium]|nr:hypothetical protein [Thermomicrobiales bacterium]
MIAFVKWAVSGNAGISLVLLLVVGAGLWRLRRKIARPWRDPDPRWRAIGRATLGLQVAFFVWVTLFDYWRQILGLTMTSQTRDYSDPYVVPPVLAHHAVAAPLRAVSLALLVLGALGLALLFYRHVGGPFLPLGAFVVGLLFSALLGDARWRMDMWAANGFPQVGKGTTGDLLVDLFFFALVVCAVAAICLLEYLTVAALFALPVVIIGDFLAQRFVRPTPEYRQFSESLRAHAAAARAEREREGLRTQDSGLSEVPQDDRALR